MLAGRLRDHPRLAGLRPAAIATSAASTALLLLFWSRAVEPWNGIVQRVAVSVPLAGMAVLAAELLRRDRDEPQERTDREDRRAVRR